MADSVIICCKTILDLSLNPGWDGDYRDFETRKRAVSEFRRRIQEGRIALYIPHILAFCAYMMARNYYTNKKLSYTSAIEKANLCLNLPALGEDKFSVNYTEAFSKATSATRSLGEKAKDVNFYEILLLVLAEILNVDAIVVTDPQKYSRILASQAFNSPIPTIKMETFLNSWNHN